jgi:peptidoglycan/LPS O-acetylase OafA/YrhL
MAFSGPVSSRDERAERTAFNVHLHGARGLFAAQLLLFHIMASDWPVYHFSQSGVGRFLFRMCEYGVELFYCVSGYVMVLAMARAAGSRPFLRDRLIRILPLLWVVVVVSGVLGMMSSQRQVWALPAGEIALVGLANMLALPGLFPIWTFNPATWSLSYEMLFYILCACWLMVPVTSPRRLRLLVLAAGGVVLLFHPRGLPFVIGMLAAHNLGVSGGALARWPGLSIALFLALWATIQALTPDGTLLIDTTLIQWASDARLPLAVLAAAFLLFGVQALVHGGGWLGVILAKPAMQFLGTISYSFYLWQSVALGASRRVIRLLISDDMNSPWAMTAFPVITVLILVPLATVSHRLIEVDFTRWLRRRFALPAKMSTTATAGTRLTSAG